MVAAVLLALGPFLAKPFNIDDPLFLKAARQIQNHPGDPYGFEVNWDDSAKPMSAVTKNPPLACYYLALAAALFGWSEPGLHLAFLMPALAAIWGTYRLGQRCFRAEQAHPDGSEPVSDNALGSGRSSRMSLAAALVTLFTPVFLVSSTSVMCDTMTLAFWVWAVVFWIEGFERDKHWRLAVAAGFIALAGLTKYFAVCLLPLLLAYGLIRKHRLGVWLGWLLIPVIVLILYDWGMYAMYGRNLLLEAGEYAGSARAGLGLSAPGTILTALAFTGGCVAPVAIASFFLWRGRFLAVLFTGTILFLLAAQHLIFSKHTFFAGSRTMLAIQIGLWAAGGISVLALAAADISRRRDAISWLLGLWVFGTFVFTALFNWTINGRSILPLTPAVALLLFRRYEVIGVGGGQAWRIGVPAGLVAGAALGLLVTRSDYLYARAVQRTVQQLHARYAADMNRTWFLGHWGFQYYMEEAGATAADASRPEASPGDYIAVPAHNPTSVTVRSAIARAQFLAQGPSWLTTMNDAVGAGFYGSFWGPLPFAFGRVPPERVVVGQIVAGPSAVSGG